MSKSGDNGILTDKIARAIEQAGSRMVSVLAANGHKSLYKKNEPKVFKAICKANDKIIAEFSNAILIAIEDAGYTNKTPSGDLRTQMISVARSLKACSFSRGYSGDGTVETSISDAMNEAKAEVKSEIGEMLLEALTS